MKGTVVSIFINYLIVYTILWGKACYLFQWNTLKQWAEEQKIYISREWHYVIAIIVDHWITVCGWVNFILISRDDGTVIVDIFIVAVRDGQRPYPQMATSENLWVPVTIKGINQQTDITLISILISGTNDWNSLK